MLFASKPKGLFVEFANHARRVVRANAATSPMVIEEFAECDESDTEGWGEIVEHFLPKKAPHGLLQSVCSVVPPKRLLRKATIEPKKLGDAKYLSEFAAGQFRIDPAAYKLAMINAKDGREYDMKAAAEKEVLITGMPKAVVEEVQEHILEESVYPERLELGSLAAIGALRDYLRFADIRNPVVMIELELDSTHSFIVSPDGVEASRLLPHGLNSMIPVVQKELGLKDEESAKKLFFSNTFDFTGMGPALIKRLLHELQSSIGFFEVQTGQSIGQVFCFNLASKLLWLEDVIAAQLGVETMSFDLKPWLESHEITFSEETSAMELSRDWFGVLSLLPRYDAIKTEEKE
ncbi:hypothetical protein [Actomonas aquatica]|uniref:ATP-dependent DNA helicase RecG C-terminal domain-containing protein n=1 Tax=Actomonas aquatica TaxID=2866162 RepID=A0ABZ1C605_9BACT|nr:hypothetical protein [Opitutus sp. WL0086]WRQ86795.1 hypothetical protein K1X11_018440 [Opitutus sp. WL0086]